MEFDPQIANPAFRHGPMNRIHTLEQDHAGTFNASSLKNHLRQEVSSNGVPQSLAEIPTGSRRASPKAMSLADVMNSSLRRVSPTTEVRDSSDLDLKPLEIKVSRPTTDGAMMANALANGLPKLKPASGPNLAAPVAVPKKVISMDELKANLANRSSSTEASEMVIVSQRSDVNIMKPTAGGAMMANALANGLPKLKPASATNVASPVAFSKKESNISESMNESLGNRSPVKPTAGGAMMADALANGLPKLKPASGPNLAAPVAVPKKEMNMDELRQRIYNRSIRQANKYNADEVVHCQLPNIVKNPDPIPENEKRQKTPTPESSNTRLTMAEIVQRDKGGRSPEGTSSHLIDTNNNPKNIDLADEKKTQPANVLDFSNHPKSFPKFKLSRNETKGSDGVYKRIDSIVKNVPEKKKSIQISSIPPICPADDVLCTESPRSIQLQQDSNEDRNLKILWSPNSNSAVDEYTAISMNKPVVKLLPIIPATTENESTNNFSRKNSVGWKRSLNEPVKEESTPANVSKENEGQDTNVSNQIPETENDRSSKSSNHQNDTRKTSNSKHSKQVHGGRKKVNSHDVDTPTEHEGGILLKPGGGRNFRKYGVSRNNNTEASNASFPRVVTISTPKSNGPVLHHEHSPDSLLKFANNLKINYSLTDSDSPSECDYRSTYFDQSGIYPLVSTPKELSWAFKQMYCRYHEIQSS